MLGNQNLYAIFSKGFQNKPDTIVIDTLKQQFRWQDIEDQTARYANLLHSCKLSPGARVAVQVEKSPEALILYLATLRAGLIYLPLNPAYRESELAYFLEDASPEVLICSPQAFQNNLPLARSKGVDHVFTLDTGGSGTLSDDAATMPITYATRLCTTDSTAAILYTSGTTGRSKGAMLTHGNLLSNAQTLHKHWDWRSSDILLHMLPIFHVHGLFVAANGALLAQACMRWLPRFDPLEAIRQLPHCTVMMGVPTYYTRLLSEPGFNTEVCRNMRLFVSGSAPLLADTFQQFQKRTGHTIVERYGMSETLMNTSNPYAEKHGKRLAGTVGPALPGIEIRVTDDNDSLCPAGTPGHVQVRGPNVFSGYWRMPEKTLEEFTHDGWFRTGDIGVLGGPQIPEHYLSIVGRSKDLIISGGFNVYPKEIETVIDALPGVLESAVFGVPHPDFGEASVAVIVPQTQAKPNLDTIFSELKKQLANYKIPKKLELIDALPRNVMGKVQKNILREQYANSFGKPEINPSSRPDNGPPINRAPG